jgi:hypothetical protein
MAAVLLCAAISDSAQAAVRTHGSDAWVPVLALLLYLLIVIGGLVLAIRLIFWIGLAGRRIHAKRDVQPPVDLRDLREPVDVKSPFYESVARGLVITKPAPADPDLLTQWRRTVESIADALAADNRAFDRERFLRECSFEASQGGETPHT